MAINRQRFRKSYYEGSQESYYNSDAPQKGYKAGRAMIRGSYVLGGKKAKVTSKKNKTGGSKAG